MYELRQYGAGTRRHLDFRMAQEDPAVVGGDSRHDLLEKRGIVAVDGRHQAAVPARDDGGGVRRVS